MKIKISSLVFIILSIFSAPTWAQTVSRNHVLEINSLPDLQKGWYKTLGESLNNSAHRQQFITALRNEEILRWHYILSANVDYHTLLLDQTDGTLEVGVKESKLATAQSVIAGLNPPMGLVKLTTAEMISTKADKCAETPSCTHDPVERLIEKAAQVRGGLSIVTESLNSFCTTAGAWQAWPWHLRYFTAGHCAKLGDYQSWIRQGSFEYGAYQLGQIDETNLLYYGAEKCGSLANSPCTLGDWATFSINPQEVDSSIAIPNGVYYTMGDANHHIEGEIDGIEELPCSLFHNIEKASMIGHVSGTRGLSTSAYYRPVGFVQTKGGTADDGSPLFINIDGVGVPDVTVFGTYLFKGVWDQASRSGDSGGPVIGHYQWGETMFFLGVVHGKARNGTDPLGHYPRLLVTPHDTIKRSLAGTSAAGYCSPAT